MSPMGRNRTALRAIFARIVLAVSLIGHFAMAAPLARAATSCSYGTGAATVSLGTGEIVWLGITSGGVLKFGGSSANTDCDSNAVTSVAVNGDGGTNTVKLDPTVTLYGEGIPITMNLGGGVDLLFVYGSGVVANSIRVGTDGISLQHAANTNVDVTGLNDVEVLYVYGGPEADTIRLDGLTSDVNPWNRESTVYAGDGNDTVHLGILGGNGRSAYGEGGNDTLYGGPANDNILGGLGNDTIYGGGTTPGQVDNIYGNGGDDIFVPNAAMESFEGGDGVDTLDFSTASAGVTLSLLTGGTGGDATDDSYTGIETVLGTPQADVIAGDDSANTLVGNLGNDQISGLGGNDLLEGGEGSDTLNGGAGIDTATFENSGGAVTVTVNGSGSGAQAAGDTLSTMENLVGSIYGDTLTGDSGANRLDGGAGADTLSGGRGNDDLYGGAGNEVLISGGAGNDHLYGDNGDFDSGVTGADKLNGDGGDDILHGEAGDDILLYGGGSDSLQGDEGTGDQCQGYAGSAGGTKKFGRVNYFACESAIV